MIGVVPTGTSPARPDPKAVERGIRELLEVVLTDVDTSEWGFGGELCSDLFPDGPSA